MSEENGPVQVIPSVPTGLGADQLIAIAENAERRIEAVKKIKSLALRVTNHHDWIDQGGKPYLAVSGAEKVARLFGISWRIDEPVRENHEDGHFSYMVNGYFSMGPTEIEVIGTRSSKDPFFGGSKDRPIPPTEIDRNDVKKGAVTNLIGNGITRLLGIRNLTWEEVEAGGINKDKMGKVTYRDSDPNAAPTLPNYGHTHCKGKPMDDPAVTVDDLRYYLSGAEKSINDPARAHWKSNNEKLRDALKAELAKREQSVEPDGAGTDELPVSTQHASEAAPISEEDWTEAINQIEEDPNLRVLKDLVEGTMKIKGMKLVEKGKREFIRQFRLECEKEGLGASCRRIFG